MLKSSREIFLHIVTLPPASIEEYNAKSVYLFPLGLETRSVTLISERGANNKRYQGGVEDQHGVGEPLKSRQNCLALLLLDTTEN